MMKPSPAKRSITRPRKSYITAIILVGLSSIHASGQTNAVGFNLSHFTDTTYDLAPTDSVGVIPTANWNNLAWESGNISPTFTDMVDQDGSIVPGMTAIAGGASPFHNISSTPLDGSVTMPDAKMMAMGKGTSSNGLSRTFEVHSVPYALYDIYVYFGGAGGSATVPYDMNVTLQEDVGGTWTSVSPTYIMTDYDSAWSGDYVRSTSTIAGTDSNYVLFEDVSLSGFRVFADNVARRAGLSGFQIVAVPEPGHYTIVLALMTLSLVCKRRKRAA